MRVRFNALIFASFNASLARSRGYSTQLNNYLFIVLLALVVNLTIPAVGILLVNALLIVPAATAANVAKNLRQMVWYSLFLSLGSGAAGLWVSRNVELQLDDGRPDELGPAGSIVVVSVIAFFASMLIQFLRKRSSAMVRSPSAPVALATNQTTSDNTPGKIEPIK
jgi:zinc transport system permease protein